MELLQSNRYSKIMGNIFGNDSIDFQFVLRDENDEKCSIFVHKRLLSILSPRFKALFSGEWNGLRKVEIDEPYFAFHAFSQCFYKNDDIVDVNNVVDLKNLAIKYEYRALQTVCENVIQQQLSVNNAVDLITGNGPAHASESVNDFISNNTSGVLKSECFLRCSPQNLESILRLEQKSCSEIVVFDACVEWARRRCAEQGIDATNMDIVRDQLGGNFKLIRFDEIDYWDLKNRWKQFERKFFTRDEIFELLVADSDDEKNEEEEESAEPPPKKKASMRRTTFSFNDRGPRNIIGKAEHSIRFSVSKNVRLTQIVVSNITVNVRKTMAIPTTVQLNVKSLKDDKEIYKSTEKFKVKKFQLLKVDHSKGILMVANEVYELYVLLQPTDGEPNNQRIFIRDHAIENLIQNDIKLIIHSTDDNNACGIISEFVFENMRIRP